MSEPTTIGEFRASALRHYGAYLTVEDLAQLSQAEFDAIHVRARDDWHKFEIDKICKINGWEKK